MDFINNTGHIFSLPSYKEKPIGYEYEEYSYIFWFESLNSSYLSINNCYIKPIYMLYDITGYSNDNLNDILSIEIYFDKSNVYKLVSPIKMQDAINNAKDLHEYINLNNLEDNDTEFIKSKLTENDIYSIKTFEQVNDHNKFDYLLIPIYVLANASEEGTWISNLMIHITNNDSLEEEWCYISIGGEFVEEYESLIINGYNFGIDLPHDILKAIYQESLYNDEYNASLFNDKMKEYLLNYMGIRGEMGNFNSAIKSLKWFGYGNKLSISKLLKTDNEFMNQYLLDYFDISYDILNSFKKFKSDSLIVLRLMTNHETGNWYEFETENFLFGENNPELESYLDKYIKVKIGNHEMPIEDDDEKYWYWKPYFNFSFNELAIKLSLLAYYYNKYFLPIHLNIHSASLGYKVYANDIKMTSIANINLMEPLVMLNGHDSEIEFPDSHLHYFTKQIHIVDEFYNEYNYDNETINNIDLYEINDTCLSIPINFKYNKYYNCLLILKKLKDNQPTYEYIFDYSNNNSQACIINDPLIIKANNKLLDISKMMFAYSFDSSNKHYSTFINSYDKFIQAIMTSCLTQIDLSLIIDYINENIYSTDTLYYVSDDDPSKVYVISYEIKQQILNKEIIDTLYIPVIPKNISIKVRTQINNIDYISGYQFNKFIISNDQILYKQNFSFIQDETHKYENFVIYPKYLNLSNELNSNLYDYWINRKFAIDLLVNNKWYSYEFKTRIDTPIIDFGTLNYRYYLNDNNYLLWKMINKYSVKNGLHSIIFQDANDAIDFNNIKNDESVYNTNNDPSIVNDNLYKFVNDKLTFIRTIDLSNIDSLWQYYFNNYNIISNFAQIKDMTDNNVIFNSYMHNRDLVISNNINFDLYLAFDEILDWHIKNNLQYINYTYLENVFYQYIEYNNLTIFIHQNNLNKDISIPLYNTQLNSIYYYNEQYIFIPINDDHKYLKIINIFEEYDNNYLQLTWNNEDNCYTYNDAKIYVYEKLNNNKDINEYYINNVYISKLNKYLNSIHMYGLYKNVDDYHNILVFHNDIDMTVNGLNFIHGRYDYNNQNKSLRFNIVGSTTVDLIDSRYPDIYGLRWNEPWLNENEYALELYGLYLKSYLNSENVYVPIEPYQFTTNDFHYEQLDDLVEIGYMIYDNMNDFNINKIMENHLYEDYKNAELFIEDDTYWFYNPKFHDLENFDQYLKTQLLWKILFIDKNGNEYDPSIEDTILNEYNIKVKFYYYNLQLIRNKFITLKQLSNKEEYNVIPPSKNNEYAIINDEQIKPIKRMKNGYLYTDEESGKEIRIQNPSMYWYNADSLNYEKLDNALNELKRYWFNENDTIDTIINNFDKYIIDELGGNDDNRKELRYEYRNYLSKDLTGQEGDFILTWDTNLEDNIFRLCICIERNDGTIEIYNNKDDQFTLYGNENHVTAYFTLRCQSLELTKDTYIEPQLVKVIHNLERITYDVIDHNTINGNGISITIDNNEYKYGDNNNINTLNLYKKFFTLRYNIWHLDHQNKDNINKLYAIYDANDLVKLNYNKLDYDLYLMHDNEYWYCIYISKQTCEEIWDDNDLVIPNELKQMILPGDEFNYYLRHEKSSKEFLINRFEYISKNGNKQFNYDDIICGRIMNNDRLPYNPYISAKWKITPMSLGMKHDSEFTSNSEISILSLPKNDNKYQKGYYNITVKYSLDRDVQHQFKNTTNIKVL